MTMVAVEKDEIIKWMFDRRPYDIYHKSGYMFEYWPHSSTCAKGSLVPGDRPVVEIWRVGHEGQRQLAYMINDKVVIMKWLK